MNAVIRLGGLMAALFAAVFGAWTAPPWLRWLAGRLRAGVSATAAAMRARPRAFAVAALAMVLLAVGGYAGRVWWTSRPQPVEVGFKVVSPPITDFANDGKPHALVVTFTTSVAPLALVGKDIASGVVATPPVEGQWRWASDRQLEFTPKAEWPVGARYSVRIDRGAVAPQVRLDAYDFTFASAAFEAKLRKAEFYQDPVNPTLKKAVFELAFTHPVNPYVLRLKSPPPLSLRANAGRAGTVYWFADSALVGSVAAGKDLVWVPPAAGKYTLSAVDARGVADTREVSVEFAP